MWAEAWSGPGRGKGGGAGNGGHWGLAGPAGARFDGRARGDGGGGWRERGKGDSEDRGWPRGPSAPGSTRPSPCRGRPKGGEALVGVFSNSASTLASTATAAAQGPRVGWGAMGDLGSRRGEVGDPAHASA